MKKTSDRINSIMKALMSKGEEPDDEMMSEGEECPECGMEDCQCEEMQEEDAPQLNKTYKVKPQDDMDMEEDEEDKKYKPDFKNKLMLLIAKKGK